MNIVFFVVLLLLIGGGVKGYKKGMVEELNNAVALLLAVVSIIMVIVAAKGYMEKETLRTIIGIVCLTIAVLVYKITDFILSSLKMITSIPVLKSVNKLLGFCLGAAEGVVLFWIVLVLVPLLCPQDVLTYMTGAIKENLLLTWMADNNYLARFLPEVLPVFSALSGFPVL